MAALAHSVSAIDRTFAALADPTRRGMVELLRSQPRRAGEIAAAFEMSAPAMSRHLRVLRESGLVEGTPLEDDARVHVYQLRAERFVELREWIAEVESFWAGQLDAFKSHAERTRGARARARARRAGRRS